MYFPTIGGSATAVEAAIEEPVWSRYSTGLKRRGLQPRLVSSDCLLRPLDRAYNPAPPYIDHPLVARPKQAKHGSEPEPKHRPWWYEMGIYGLAACIVCRRLWKRWLSS